MSVQPLAQRYITNHRFSHNWREVDCLCPCCSSAVCSNELSLLYVNLLLLYLVWGKVSQHLPWCLIIIGTLSFTFAIQIKMFLWLRWFSQKISDRNISSMHIMHLCVTYCNVLYFNVVLFARYQIFFNFESLTLTSLFETVTLLMALWVVKWDAPRACLI